jgi:myo-inositol-1(or 4)-monophosphatase
VSVDSAELLDIADAAIDRVVPRLREASTGDDLAVHTKSGPTDLVTEFDRWSEATIVDTISTARPGDGFVGEEGASAEGTTGVVWLIDPIDGTTNFVYDLPGSSVSIAARVNGVVAAGAVHDLVRDERFRATLDRGATLDGCPIHASDKAELATALVATGFSYDADRRRAQATALVEVLPAVRDIRRLGGAAVDLCSLACGRVDAYYERGLSEWDFAAGALIAKEAGAVIADRGRSGGALCGAAPGIADAFFALIESSGAHDA